LLYAIDNHILYSIGLFFKCSKLEKS